jgi:hypothetical protein
MRLITTGFVGQGIAKTVNRAEECFIDALRRELAPFHPRSGLEALLLSPRILPPDIPGPPDTVRYARKDRVLAIARGIPYEEWVNGSVADRVRLYREMLVTGLHTVPDRYLTERERSELVAAVEATVTLASEDDATQTC